MNENINIQQWHSRTLQSFTIPSSISSKNSSSHCIFGCTNFGDPKPMIGSSRKIIKEIKREKE